MSDARPTPAISRELYREFIQGLDISAIWLIGANIENNCGVEGPSVPGTVAVEDSYTWAPVSEGFDVQARYEASFKAGDERPFGKVVATFGLRYTSKVAMTDLMFETFQRANLPVNGWPYFREFLANTLTRMGWPPFVLPVLKRGTAPKTDAKPTEP